MVQKLQKIKEYKEWEKECPQRKAHQFPEDIIQIEQAVLLH